MNKSLTPRQRRMWILFIFNLFCGLLAPTFITVYDGLRDHILVFLVVAALLIIIDRSYARHLYWTTRYLLFLLVQLIVSNLALTWLVIQPKLKLDPGIVAVPLNVKSDFETTAVAGSTTLTPGTITVELSTDEQGNRVLYIHALHVGNPDSVRAAVKNGVERRIFNISKSAAS